MSHYNLDILLYLFVLKSCYVAIIKPTGRKLLGRYRRRWEGDITIDLKEIYVSTRNWIDSARDRDFWRTLMNAALNLRVPITHGVSYFIL